MKSKYFKLFKSQYAKVLSGSALIRVFSIFSGFFISMILARVLEPQGFGVYSYVFSVITLITLPTKSGIPEVLIRETVKLKSGKEAELLLGLWRWGGISCVILSFFAMTICFALCWFDLVWEDYKDTFFWGIFLIPMMTLAGLRGAILLGLKKVIIGQLPDNVIRPMFLLLFLILSLFVGIPIGSEDVMVFHVLACVVAFAAGAYLLKINTTQYRPAKAKYRNKAWVLSALPLSVTSAMFVINQNIDTIILGFLVEPSQIGVYKVAAQFGFFVIFGQQMARMAMSSYMAECWYRRDLEKLHGVVRASAVSGFVIALVATIIFIALGQILLKLFFGHSYLAAYVPMIILCLGQLINAGFGPVGTLLNMTGNEKYCLLGVGLGVVANVILSIMLTPMYGIIGAALAVAISILIWNLALWFFVRKIVKIDPTIIAFIRK